MLSNHCNVTGLLRLLQVNIQVFKIIKWTWRRPLKTGFAQISSRCPKNLSCPNFGGGGCSPPRLPGPYAYADCSLRIKRERQKVTKVKCKRDKSLQQGLSLEYILLKYSSFRRSQTLTIKQIYLWSPMTTNVD